MIAVVIVCVVDTGACSQNAFTYRTTAETDSATKPRAGSSSMMRRPSVRMMRLPPVAVPAEIAAAARILISHGMASPFVVHPIAVVARNMTPMVFCASWSPWPSAMAAADAVCAMRKRRDAFAGATFLKTHRTPTMTRNARPKPTVGEMTIGRTTFSTIDAQ